MTKSVQLVTKRKVGRPPGSRSIDSGESSSPSVGRDLLIEITCELLKTTPPAEITRALVARRAGVDPSLIRYYFSNRSKVLIAAAERLTERFEQMVEEAATRSDGSPRSMLRERIRALIDLIAAYPYFHRLFVEEIIPSADPEAQQVFDLVTARGVVGYDAILQAGADQGAFRKVDAALLFTAVIGLSEFYGAGTRIVEKAWGRPVPEAELRDRYTDFVCDLIIDGIGHRAGT